MVKITGIFDDLNSSAVKTVKFTENSVIITFYTYDLIDLYKYIVTSVDVESMNSILRRCSLS